MKKFFRLFVLLSVLVFTFSLSNLGVSAKGLSAPTKFTTSSKGHSTTLKWNRVSGATGYEVYYRNSSSNKYKKLKYTSSTTATHSNLKGNSKYFYKVRSYSSRTGVAFSPYSKVIAITTTIPATPKVLTFLTPKTNPSASAIAMGIINAGKKNIYIKRDANLYDRNYKNFNRPLILALLKGDNLYYPNPLVIKPNEEKIVLFEVQGERTWYDEESTIYFEYKHEGKDYYQFATTDDNRKYANWGLDY